MDSEIARQLEDMIRDRMSYPGEILPYTELYYDMGLYGDDVDDLLGELEERFDVDFSEFVFSDYFADEGADFLGLKLLLGWRPYNSLYFADLVDAIQNRKFTPPSADAPGPLGRTRYKRRLRHVIGHSMMFGTLLGGLLLSAIYLVFFYLPSLLRGS